MDRCDVITAEFTQPTAPPAIPPQDRDYLWRSGFPPEHWQIQMGFYGGIEKLLSYAEVRFALHGKVMNTQVTSMIFVKLFLHAFSSAVEGLGPLPLSNDISAKLQPIWPSKGSDINWPPTLGLAYEDVASLREELLSRLGVLSHD